MRKLLAAFFLFIFAFNVGGYYLMFWGLQYHASREIETRADAGAYTKADEVTFRVLFSLPYTVEQDEFTRANGEFEHDGAYYQIIKQKIVDGHIILVCLKNQRQQNITRAFSDITKINDLPGDNGQNLRTLVKLFKDFQSSPESPVHAGNAWSLEIGSTPVILSSDPPCTEITGPPPRVS